MAGRWGHGIGACAGVVADDFHRLCTRVLARLIRHVMWLSRALASVRVPSPTQGVRHGVRQHNPQHVHAPVRQHAQR